MSISSIFFAILGLFALSVLFEGIRIAWYLITAIPVINIAEKFKQLNPSSTKRILFIGDSVGCSVGASHARYSIAGRLGANFPEAHVENRSEGEMRLSRISEILEEVYKKEQTPFDLIIIMVGGIDLVLFTPLSFVRNVLQKAILLSKKCGNQTILISPNNTGLAPLYRFPLSNLYKRRARKFDALYRDIAEENGILHASLFQEQSDSDSSPSFFSPDRTHPNDDGYEIWYNRIKETIAMALEKS